MNIEQMHDFDIHGRKGNSLMCMEQNQKLIFCYCRCCYNSFCLPSSYWLHLQFFIFSLCCIYLWWARLPQVRNSTVGQARDYCEDMLFLRGCLCLWPCCI